MAGERVPHQPASSRGAAAESLPLPIRRGMDVFSAYQDQYIGTVVEVLYAGAASGGGAAGEGGDNPTGSEARPRDVGLVHEEGATVGHGENRGKRVLGEESGPVPTIAIGNTGPVNQSAAHAYATGPDAPLPDVIAFAVRPGRVNLGPLTRPLYVPVNAIRSISMERIALDVQRNQIPASWRQRPGR